MKNHITTSLKMLLVLTLLTGAAYPLLMTLSMQLAFPHQANGSIMQRNGKAIGSELLGQKFTSDTYFWSRPSAIDYAPLPSGGSNMGPTNKDLQKAVEERRKTFIEKNNLPANTIVPNDMLFASGSGLDQHISPEAAMMQVARVANARKYDERKKNALYQLVQRHIEEPTFGLLGEPRVNVVKLNIAVDGMKN